MNEHDDTYEIETPDELRGIESALDRLGVAERASAPRGLEARVHRGIRGADDATSRPLPMHRRRTSARVAARLTALAALVAVVGGAWVALLSTNHAPPPSDTGVRLVSLEQSVDDLLALEALLDEMASVDTTAAQDEADEIDTMIGSPWDMIEKLDAAMGEEAI